MANNRILLIDKETGESVTLLKYYPSTGWYQSESMKSRVETFLAKYAERSLASMEGKFFRIEYE